jgi:hypothetical protein
MTIAGIEVEKATASFITTMIKAHTVRGRKNSMIGGCLKW